jgi:ATP-binding protein involved in chromosome partitioning
VTTPGQAAQMVAARAASMARKSYLRVLGVVENMSSFTCEDGHQYPLFGTGGGQRLAADIGAPLLASIPIEPAISLGGDQGRPAALDGLSKAGRAFAELVGRVVEMCPVLEMASCSARLLQAVEAAAGPVYR